MIAMRARSRTQIPAPRVVESAILLVAIAVVTEGVIAHLARRGTVFLARPPAVRMRDANDDRWAVSLGIVATQIRVVVTLAAVIIVTPAMGVITPAAAAGANEDGTRDVTIAVVVDRTTDGRSRAVSVGLVDTRAE